MGDFIHFPSSFSDLSQVIVCDNAISRWPTILLGAVKRLENTFISMRGVDESSCRFIKEQRGEKLLSSNSFMHWSALTYVSSPEKQTLKNGWCMRWASKTENIQASLIDVAFDNQISWWPFFAAMISPCEIWSLLPYSVIATLWLFSPRKGTGASSGIFILSSFTNL